MIECGATYLPIAPTNSLPLRRAPVCAVLLRCLGGFGGVLGGVEAAYVQVMERLAEGL